MTLGIIGGLGPMATAHFFEQIVKMTDADRDQDHLEILIYNQPGIPDRTRFLLGESREDPLPAMIALGQRLKTQGAGCIAIPCITAHCFHRQLQEGIDLPVIHGVRETARVLQEAEISRAGIMATDGTVQCGIFQEELEQRGITPLLPSPAAQKTVMDLIYRDVKAGRPAHMEDFYRVRDELRAAGAQVVILGCTELSVIHLTHQLEPGFLDAMDVLAKRAVEFCGKRVKPEYQALFSKL